MAEDTKKRSKFEEMTGSSHQGAIDRAAAHDAENGVDDAGADFVPRAIFVKDQKPDISKMQISQLRLAQGMTAEVSDKKAQIGQYVLTNFPAKDEVVLVPLATQSIRVFKPDPKQPPQCQAPTGVHGIGDPGILCADCPLSHWGAKNPKTGKRTPPRCKEGVHMRAYSLTHRSVVDFSFMGRGASSGAFIQQQAMAYGYGGFAIKMGASQVKNDLGAWYEPAIEIMDEIPEEHQEIAAKWYDAVMGSIEDTSESALIRIEAEAASRHAAE